MEDEAIEALADDSPEWLQSERFWNQLETLENESFRLLPIHSHALHERMLQAGYDPERDGNRDIAWLLHFLALKLSL